MLARPESRMDIRWEERPFGAHSAIAIDGKEQPGALELRWPNQMVLYIPAPGRMLVMQVACVPIDESRTRMLMITARDFLRFRLLDPIFFRMNRRIASEDQAIVESSWPAEVPPAAAERSVRTDALPLHFRKRYFKELRASALAETPRRALPVLPEPS
jgi:phenylpropionate dioxygenase-like ring-hydroxylating dioxygenase large terminal subunit